MARTSRGGIAAVDLFCGLGGLTLGLISAGIDVRAGIDIDPACRAPYELNNPGVRFLQRDVRSIKGAEIQELWGTGAETLLAGCAPCQPFSAHSQKFRACDRPGWDLLLEFARLVREAHPQHVTMENVPGIARNGVFAEFKQALDENGYQVGTYPRFDCSSVGLPQRRIRFVLVASRGKLPAELRRVPPSTVKNEIGHLERLAAGESSDHDPLHFAAALSARNLARIQASLPGGTWHDWPADLVLPCHRGSAGKSYTPVYGRMEWDGAAPTITTQFFNYGSGRFGHPEQDRAITPREALILQGFPPAFTFGEKRPTMTELGRLIGNAVPPALGKAIGMAISRGKNARRPA